MQSGFGRCLRGMVTAGAMILCGMATAACPPAGTGKGQCRPPELGEWLAWQAVLGDDARPTKSTEADAVADVVAVLQKRYPCGLSFAAQDLPFKATASVWNWALREEATRLVYVGFVGEGAACQGVKEQAGLVTLRRARTVSCPRGWGWQVLDDAEAMCVRD